MTTILLAIVLGIGAGVMSGLFGLGGGILFVRRCSRCTAANCTPRRRRSPRFFRPSVPGIWRQQRYGNVRWRAALIIGIASIAGVEAGVQVATSLPETTLRRLFAALLFAVAANIAWRRRHS